jgi:4a-hydroxytetrahydrobiopterin dehydratase
MEKIAKSELKEQISQLDGWVIEDDKWLVKKYRFQQYLEGIEFVNKIAQLSEEVNHHPFISIDFKLITLKLTSWKARGLTEQDFQLARKYDQLYDYK